MQMFDAGVDLVRYALLLSLLLAGPILAAGLLIGLAISVFQTVTSIQEQTLTFVPKIAAMILVTIVMVPWLLNKIVAFSEEMFAGLPGG
ncbi:MAG: flagellar biosynthetic protein FliQ [Planctomycetota bacterium]